MTDRVLSFLMGAATLWGDSDVLRVFLIFLGGSLSFSGGLIYILCSQPDPARSRMVYLRFWWGVLSRHAWTRRVFLSNPFAPSPQLPNLIFLANGLVSMGFEVYRAVMLYQEQGIRLALLTHGPLLLVLMVITVNNTILALSLYGNDLPNRVTWREICCAVGATVGLITLVWATVQRHRFGQERGDYWAWISLAASLFVRAVAVVGFVLSFTERYRNLTLPATRGVTPRFPPAYGFLFFLMGSLVALANTPLEGRALIHPVSLFLQSLAMWSFLRWITWRYEIWKRREGLT